MLKIYFKKYLYFFTAGNNYSFAHTTHDTQFVMSAHKRNMTYKVFPKHDTYTWLLEGVTLRCKNISVHEEVFIANFIYTHYFIKLREMMAEKISEGGIFNAELKGLCKEFMKFGTAHKILVTEQLKPLLIRAVIFK